MLAILQLLRQRLLQQRGEDHLPSPFSLKKNHRFKLERVCDYKRCVLVGKFLCNSSITLWHLDHICINKSTAPIVRKKSFFIRVVCFLLLLFLFF